MPPPSGKKHPGKPPPPVEGTYLESDDEIRQALEERRARQAGKQAPAPLPSEKAPVAAPLAPVLPEATPEKPKQRPPLGLLCICDDGKQDGEWVRLREDRYVIGRVDGDILIPHDGLMSSRHAELVRHETQPGSWRWGLVDLKSRNGTFVRVGKTLLREGTEFLIGGGLYRFEPAAPSGILAAAAPGGQPQMTQPRLSQPVQAFVPSLIEIVQGTPTQRFLLTVAEIWIGRDPQSCNICRRDDPLASPRHARLYRDSRGQWYIENQKSLNGLWLRVDQIPLDAACQFRLGEQVFLFRVPS